MKKIVETKLSVHPDVEPVISDLRKKYMEGDLENLPEVNENEISIDGVYAFDNGEGVEVSFFIRNAAPFPIRLESVPLIITNSKGEKLAHQKFDMSGIGEIPSEGARPWKVVFDRENVYTNEIPSDDWKIIFSGVAKSKRFQEEKKDIHVNVRFEKLPEEFSKERIERLEEVLYNLQPLKMGEFNISPINLDVKPDGRLIITVIVRNGSEEAIKIENLPLKVKDANDKEFASALFEMDDFIVSPFCARVVNLSFSSEGFLLGDIDLTKWYLEFGN